MASPWAALAKLQKELCEAALRWWLRAEQSSGRALAGGSLAHRAARWSPCTTNTESPVDALDSRQKAIRSEPPARLRVALVQLKAMAATRGGVDNAEHRDLIEFGSSANEKVASTRANRLTTVIAKLEAKQRRVY